jgi:K+-transporting ATPase ATPase C chain
METTSETRKKSVYRPIIAVAVLSLLVCGLLFPLVVTGIAQVAFPNQANGSLVQLGNRTVGSYYIDNGFTLPIFFHARNSSASASGVDPDITLKDALNQTLRIHNATSISTVALTNLVMAHVEYTLLVTGDQYVNVLALNLALISEFPSVYSAYG